jgi:tellurite resistance protein TerB
MFGKILGKIAGNGKAELKKVENRDLMQAIVAGCLLISNADGEIEKAEAEALDKLLRANPSMSHFGSEITETISRFTEMLSAGSALARVKIMREIEDIKNVPSQAEEAFACMVDVAQSDGELEPAEAKVLAEIGRKLNMRLQDWGIAA